MHKSPSQKRAVEYLHPPIDPYDQRMMDTGDGHRIYVEQCGNPEGVPVVVFHGGPGGGCSPAMRRYFDPAVYRIILFDQRGCGRSRPHASVVNNTSWHLVADIEQIRAALGIERWILFGGSWGATLALIYAQTHPQRTAYMALRGVFLMTQAELKWFYGGGAGQFWPELWEDFIGLVNSNEQDDLIGAFNRRLFSGDILQETRYARAWAAWENALAMFGSEGRGGDSPAEYARAFARLENHYFVNAGFLEEDEQLLNNAPIIAHIPATIVQGRYDMICPPRAAFRLSQRLPEARLEMIPGAGHALSEPGISAELIRVMAALPSRFSELGLKAAAA
ncbi:prolyl aminopeptidase [Brevirhabdus sp.]|uniref:prolyl aminopeptidase n=1 Tax=Brevirhabdus sp. TaxID=2004514 RepID=UPI0040586045